MCAGVLDRLSVLLMPETKNHLQMKASTALCTGLADVLDVALATAISSEGGIQEAAIAFLGSFCVHCTTNHLAMVLVPSHFNYLGNGYR
jgi:hypothetical protein